MKSTYLTYKNIVALLALIALVPPSAHALIEKKVSVSSNDSSAGYLNGKLVAGTGITFTENSDGSTETLTITNGLGTADGAAEYIYIEGATADNFETILGSADPTADRTFLFPNASLAAGDVLVGLSANTLTYLPLATTQILIGDGSGAPTAASLSGDATMDNAGAVTIANNAVDGTDIALGSDTAGDLMYYNGTDWARLAKGVAGQYLKTDTTPAWDTPAGAGDMLEAIYDTAGDGTVDDAANVTCAGCVADAELASTFLKVEADATVDTSAEIQAIIGANIYQADDVDLDTVSAGITGIVKGAGNGNGYSAASAGTDYEVPVTAGRSLTRSTNDILADAELYTKTICYRLPASPVATDDDKSIWMNDTANAFTVTKLWAESDQTVTMMLQVDDGSPADMDTVDLAPAAGVATDTTLDGDTTIAAGDRVDLDVASVASTPTWATICFTGTWDD